jgi:hypothetical protein
MKLSINSCLISKNCAGASSPNRDDRNNRRVARRSTKGAAQAQRQAEKHADTTPVNAKIARRSGIMPPTRGPIDRPTKAQEGWQAQLKKDKAAKERTGDPPRSTPKLGIGRCSFENSSHSAMAKQRESDTPGKPKQVYRNLLKTPGEFNHAIGSHELSGPSSRTTPSSSVRPLPSSAAMRSGSEEIEKYGTPSQLTRQPSEKQKAPISTKMGLQKRKLPYQSAQSHKASKSSAENLQPYGMMGRDRSVEYTGPLEAVSSLTDETGTEANVQDSAKKPVAVRNPRPSTMAPSLEEKMKTSGIAPTRVDEPMGYCTSNINTSAQDEKVLLADGEIQAIAPEDVVNQRSIIEKQQPACFSVVAQRDDMKMGAQACLWFSRGSVEADVKNDKRRCFVGQDMWNMMAGVVDQPSEETERMELERPHDKAAEDIIYKERVEHLRCEDTEDSTVPPVATTPGYARISPDDEIELLNTERKLTAARRATKDEKRDSSRKLRFEAFAKREMSRQTTQKNVLAMEQKGDEQY